MSNKISSRVDDDILPSVWPPPLIDNFGDQWPLMVNMPFSLNIANNN